jgi:hypothetical protein
VSGRPLRIGKSTVTATGRTTTTGFKRSAGAGSITGSPQMVVTSPPWRALVVTYDDPLLKWTFTLLPARWGAGDPQTKWLTHLIPARWRTGDPGTRWKEGR